MIKTLKSIETYAVFITLFLIPIAVLSIFPSAFVTTKVVILFLGVSVALMAKAIRTFMSGSLEFTRSKFDMAVLLLAFAALISAVLVTPNKTEAFFLPGTATALVFGALYYFLLTSRKQTERPLLQYTLVSSGFVVAVITLLAFSNILSKFGFLPLIFKSNFFTALETTLTAIIFFVVLVPVSLSLVAKSKQMWIKLVLSVGTALLLLAAIASISNIRSATEKNPNAFQHLDTKTSWLVFFDTVKNSPLFGSGPANYLSSFTRFKPPSFNNQEYWTTRFTSARNFYFTYSTETGIIGVFALVVLGLTMYKVIKSSAKKNKFSTPKGLISKSNLVSLIFLLILILIFPATFTLVFLLFVLLGLVALDMKPKTMSINLTASTLSSDSKLGRSRLPALLVTLPIITLSLFLFVRASRFVLAEANYKSALDAVSNNDIQGAVTHLSKAVKYNPRVDRYHLTDAQLNLAIAQSLVQKEEITDQDRQAIALAIQNAIAQGKVVVALNPTRAPNWEMLANTYRLIAPLAKGSEAFAIQSYGQAIVLDPYNPNNRVALGRIYYGLGDYEKAIDAFKLAIIAKPDHANAHYNLAIAYRDNGDTDKAIEEITIVLALVEKDSPDYEVALAELKRLDGTVVDEAENEGIGIGAEELNPPQPIEPELDPQLDLPRDAEPEGLSNEEDVLEEEVENTASPKPTPTPTIQP